MHKSNYIAIARILAGDFAIASPAGKSALFRTTLSLADFFLRENPNFRREQFYAAVFGTANLDEVRPLLS